jgi:DNA modification methylase
MLDLRLGDCLEVLSTLPDNSVDSLVTDPPAGISFMGKAWDDDKGGRDSWIAWLEEVMRECLRVMKPGAHGLVWAIPRTSHWTATALEDAGFEIRDVVTHLFGTGFPKSLDVSKAIDKAAGAEREAFYRPIAYPDSDCWGVPNSGGQDASQSNALFPVGDAEKGGLRKDSKPATPEAKQWSGWGTALKPASEHWILVRKPLSEKTVAANVLKWGTGGINIDGCRIQLEANPKNGVKKPGMRQSESGFGGGMRTDYNPSGRFPANLVLDEAAAEMLDAQSGEIKTKLPFKKISQHTFTPGQQNKGQKYESQKGLGITLPGASRFFYVAKASRADKGEENPHPTVKSTKLMRYFCRLVTPPGGVILDPFAGSGTTGVAAKQEKFSFVGIERELEYLQIAKRRIEATHVSQD